MAKHDIMIRIKNRDKKENIFTRLKILFVGFNNIKLKFNYNNLFIYYNIIFSYNYNNIKLIFKL